MATYYVRKTGDDAAAGTSAGAAWLTIDKAANTVAAGDTVYVGAGTYREQVTMDTSGSSGSVIRFEADVTGEQTGDAGLVVISAFSDSNTASAGACWFPDEKTFIEVAGFVMQGGTSAVVFDIPSGNPNYEGVVFEDCVFIAGPNEVDHAFKLDFAQATTPTNAGLTIRRCVYLNGGNEFEWDGNETAEQDLKVTIENCVFVLNGGNSIGASQALFWDVVTTGTYGSGGVTFSNNSVYGTPFAVVVDHGTSTTYPVAVRNCVISAGVCLNKGTSNDGALTSNYNSLLGDVTNVTLGGNDRQETSTWMPAGIADIPLYRFWGWSPFQPWEEMRPPGDDDWSSLIGDANAADAPATDLYNFPRPMHGTADDRGAVEGRARLEPETTTKRTGDTAGRFDGAGRHIVTCPVAASSTTVSVYARKDSSYTGTAPQLKVSRIPGVADQTDTHTAAADTWEELTVTFTPSAAGVAIIELISNDTSAGGQCFFDDLTVT